MSEKAKLIAVDPRDLEPRKKATNYPEPFASRVENRIKRPLTDLFGLKNFGVNFTVIEPGAQSSVMHNHAKQDEFVYIISGTVELRGQDETITLHPGMCAGFPAGGAAHHLVNVSTEPAEYLEIGDRTPGDEVDYPQDDLVAKATDSGWAFTHKDGTPY